MLFDNETPPTTARKVLEIIPYVMRLIASEMRQTTTGLRPTHFRLLGLLTHRAWTLTELAESQAVSAPTMSNTITTLEQRGWVTRVRSEEDRRVVLIQATEEGHRIIHESVQRVEQYIASMLESLEPAEQDILDSGLDVLRQVFERAVSAECAEEEGYHSGAAVRRERDTFLSG